MKGSRDGYEEALAMLACPYYRDGGECASLGVTCWEEPACIVNEPTGGWQSVVDAYLATAAPSPPTCAGCLGVASTVDERGLCRACASLPGTVLREAPPSTGTASHDQEDRP